jgi:hypothetical protein
MVFIVHRGGAMSKTCLVVAFSLLSVSLQAQWLDHKALGIPRTADGKPDLKAPTPKAHDGKPDLTGLWTLGPASGGLSAWKKSEIPLAAEKVVKEHEESLGKDGPSTLCLPGAFISAQGPGLIKIVQTPGLILMLAEDLEYRQIFMDGRELPKDPNPAWMGYSVGRWDGDTLVVESTGYNERTWVDAGAGYPHTENMRITERIRRSDFGHLTIEATWSDPKIYEKSWVTKVNGILTPDTELLEYVCAENNRDLPHLVGKNSDDTKKAVKVAPEILSKYTGTYMVNLKEIGFGIPGAPEVIPVDVIVEEGALNLTFGTGGPKQPMTALSETTFTGMGGRIEFDKGGQYFIIKIAEGDFRAPRKK